MQLGTISRNHIIGLIIFIEIALIGAFVWLYVLPTQDSTKQIVIKIGEKKTEVDTVEQKKNELEKKRKENEKLAKDISNLEKFFSEQVYIPRTLLLLEMLAQSTKIDIIRIKPIAEEKAPARRPSAETTPPAGGAPPPAAKAQAASPDTNKTAPAAGGAASGTVATGSASDTKTFNSDSEYRKQGLELEMQGQFKSMYNFLGELKGFPKLVVVDLVELTKVQSTGTTSGATPAATPNENSLSAKMRMTFYVQRKKAAIEAGGMQPEEKGTAEKPPQAN